MAEITHANWGVGDKLPAPFDTCVITDSNETTEAQQAYEYDQYGRVIGVTVYDRLKTKNLTVQVPKTLTPPDVGTTIDFGGGGSDTSNKYIVKNTQRLQTNRDYIKIQMTLERWTNEFDPTDVTTTAN